MSKAEFCMSVRIGARSYAVVSDDEYLQNIEGTFEPDLLRLLGTFVDSSSTCADVGANIGMTALFLAEISRRTICFEPCSSTFKFLERNIRTAGMDHCIALNIGLGATAKEESLTFAHANRSGGFVSDLVQPSLGHRTERVRIDTLDAVWGHYAQSLDLLKIDVEGYEQEVIEGGLETISRYRPVVILELNHWCLNAFRRRSVPDFFDFLRPRFPQLYAVDHGNSTVRDLHDANEAYEVLHEHIVHFRFPNLVAGYDEGIRGRLEYLTKQT